MTLHVRVISLALLAILVGCASEDPNIVDPPPGSRKILLRMFNMVPDGSARRMLLEGGFQTGEVGQFRFSDTLRSPGDSSLIEVLRGGVTEFRTPERARFLQNSVYNAYAVPGLGGALGFDTLLISNSTVSQTTLPVAQIRVVNLIADSARSFDVRIGCPNGPRLTNFPTPSRGISLYHSLYPGLVTFSVIDLRGALTRQLGTFEFQLDERQAYSIIMYRDAASDDAQMMLVQETDLTQMAARMLVPVTARTARVRGINLSASRVDIVHITSSTNISTSLATYSIGSRTPVSACEQEQADVFEARFSNGKTAIDSIALSVGGSYTVIAVDSLDEARLTIATPIQRPFGASGKAVLRVIHAAAGSGPLVVSIASRTDPTHSTGIASGVTVARGITYDSYSDPIAIAPGEIPLTITSATTPTTIRDVTGATVEADKNYDIVLYSTPEGLQTLLIEDNSENVAIQPLPENIFLRVLNGSTTIPNASVSIGSVISSGTLFSGNSLATTVPVGVVQYSIGGVAGTWSLKADDRITAVLADGGGVPNVFAVISSPLLPKQGFTSRRVINATMDIGQISVCVDSIPTVSGNGDYLAREVAYGTSSEPFVTSQDRRGLYFFYNTVTREELYRLPIQFSPLGNNFSLVVIGNKQNGYGVVVSQEF